MVHNYQTADSFNVIVQVQYFAATQKTNNYIIKQWNKLWHMATGNKIIWESVVWPYSSLFSTTLGSGADLHDTPPTGLL